jgi:DNA-binding NarL/FixJ family response regulator
VVLDLAMPTLGGHDVFLRLRGINPDVRAVVASGFSLDGEAQAVLDAGARAFVQKPFDRQALARAIAQACAS